MDSFDKTFDINFSSLKTGTHEFKYVIDDTFFDQLELERDFKESQIEFDVLLNKSENMLTFDFELKGTAKMPCGRCMDDVEFNISGDYRQVVKFGEETIQEDELWVLGNSEYKINIGPLIYEFSMLSMPSNVHHENEEDCNEEYLESISDYLLTEAPEENDQEDEEDTNDEIDPRWSQLQNLKYKNN
ncbi:MAG: DUF177 domain-containing protein [Crocinitomicaceae bacterium]|nr:DUF177 domain-containing protein [Crocinitomicaceae bacterium]